MIHSESIADRLASELPSQAEAHLVETLGLSEETIAGFKLGWNGVGITIPVFDRRHRLPLFRVVQFPNENPRKPRMKTTPADASPELYGWEHLAGEKSPYLIVCGSELERLVLESHGLFAVTTTDESQPLKEEWISELREIRDLFVCYANDKAGRERVEEISRALPHVQVIKLPREVGPGGTVIDFFGRLRGTDVEFGNLMLKAQIASLGESKNHS